VPIAGNFIAAAAFASQNVQYILQTGGQNLLTQLNLWLAAIPAALSNPENIGQRTVYNFVPIGRELADFIPALEADQNQVHANSMSVFVYRSCKGISYAQAGGRISAAQETALRASYNAIIAY
jgi:hypothetical protein